jgi:protein ImuB
MIVSTSRWPVNEVRIEQSRRTKTSTVPYSPLWLCIYLPKLALEALDRTLLDKALPRGVIEDIAGQRVIHTASVEAESAGITAGMSIAAAQALCPKLQVHGRDPKAEEETLSRLAVWARQFTPVISLQPPQALLLEIRGSLRLFGDLSTLHRRLCDELSAQIDHFLVTVAPTSLASLLLASHGNQTVITRREDLRSALGSLPIGRLPLEPNQIKHLTRAGLHELRDLWRLPRDGLARRFGPGLLDYLDRALGMQPEVRDVFRVPGCFAASLELPAEIGSLPILLQAARHLIDKLIRYLRARDAGITRLQFTLYHIHQPASRIEIGIRHSSRDESHWLSLLAEHLDRLRLPAPVIEMRLASKPIQPFTPVSGNLFAQQPTVGKPLAPQQEWDQMLEHLQARLGRKALHGLQALADHRPEQAWCYTPSGIPQAPAPSIEVDRPLWLLPEPQPLDLEQNRLRYQGNLSLELDPERIEGGWWEGRDISRDYYIATDVNGSRLWIFRDLSRDYRWYLHGLFG